MARPEKAQRVESFAALMSEARCIVLNDFTGLDVEKISALRKLFREAGLEYRVVKNTLAKRSIKGTPAEELDAFFEGPTAIAVSRDSENLPAKIIAKFAEEYEAPKFKAGIVEGNVIDVTGLIALAKLPPREELLAKLLGTLQGPGNALASVLQGTLRNLLYAMNAIIDKKQSEGGSGASPQESSNS
jgi:large subunit ribosomal protein L10